MQLFMSEMAFPAPKEFQKMYRVGITGGIGAGKSVVSRILRCNGFHVYDCDMRAKFLMTNDLCLKKELQEHIGEEVYLKDGALNKKFLSEKIFKDSQVRSLVNGLVHRAVRLDIEEKCNKGLNFIESAIPVTGGLVQKLDKIWIVEAPLNIRIERTITRDSLTESEVVNRIVTQEKEFSDLPVNKKSYIQNDDKDSIIVRIIKLLEELRELHY